VHLSNGFRMVEGAEPLRAGDVCKAEARISSVINTDAGKAVKVAAFILRNSKPVVEVTSCFLYRGRFTDYENTFEIVEEPDYVVSLENDAAVGVLQSKEWFEWREATKPLQAGTSLIFRLKSEVTFRGKSIYHSVTVSGDVFVRDQIKRLVKVGYVDFEQDDCQGNPVLAYVQRHGAAEGTLIRLPDDGYTMTDSTSVLTAPFTNEPYSKTSGDFNPIHINPYFSNFASLPGTITHGMWTSAATRKYVETVVAQGHTERVVS
jgi:fatty acid synthase subunit alpha, fungi type